MSANFFHTTFQCYQDCRREGCPGHRLTLVEKHGGVRVFVDPDDTKALDQQTPILETGWDIVNAIAAALTRA